MPVEFVCPEEGCDNKGFDEPRTTPTQMACHKHPFKGPVRMVQNEFLPVAQIPSIAVKAPGESGFGSGASVDPQGGIRGNNFLNRDENGNQAPLSNDPSQAEKFELQREYFELVGHPPDRRWGLEKLRTNLEHEKTTRAEQADEETP